jgi:hypothetical protein
MRSCSVLGCEAKYFAKGFCKPHYYSSVANPGRRRNLCSIPECPEPVRARGLCNNHYRKSPEYTSTVRVCRKCGKSYIGACKSCHARIEAIRRAKLSPEERAAHLQKLREWNSQFRTSLSRQPLERQVYYWAKRIIKRSSKGGRYQSRSVVPLDTLIALALKGKERFPYMNFSSTRGIDKTADIASLDKVNPKGQYEVGNIRVVPLWLNMAKCDLTERGFASRLKHYLSQKKGV